MLNEVEYRSYITGYPAGIAHHVRNPHTGEEFDFSGIAGTTLLYTIASLEHALRPDGSLPEATERHYLGLAGYQMNVASGAPIQWVCQRRVDADALRSLLERYSAGLRQVAPLGSLQVRSVTPESETVG